MIVIIINYTRQLWGEARTVRERSYLCTDSSQVSECVVALAPFSAATLSRSTCYPPMQTATEYNVWWCTFASALSDSDLKSKEVLCVCVWLLRVGWQILPLASMPAP